MFKTLKLAAALLIAGTVSAAASTIQFKPTNDPLGHVFSTNSNDIWNGGRGIGFQVSSSQKINSVGLLQNLNHKTLSYGIYEISALSGSFTRGTALRSGSAQTTTAGLAWSDFSFAELTLDVGKAYLLEFKFNGASVQNFFYNNANVAWSQGAFTKLEGTAGSSFSNSVVGAFRIGQPDIVIPVIEPDIQPVPLPAGLPLLIGGIAAFGLLRRRKG